MLELLESLLGCLVRHSFCFVVIFFPSLSGCSLNKDVLFYLSESRLTKSGLYKD